MIRKAHKRIFFLCLSFLLLILIFAEVRGNSENISNSSLKNISTQEVYDDLKIEYVVAGPNSHGKDVLDIQATVKYNDTGEVIGKEDMDVHKFHIYSDEEGNTEVLEGDLEFDSDREEWVIEDHSLFWTPNGKLYVTVEFKTEDMSKSLETDIDDSADHTYSRASIWELIIIIAIIIGIAVAVVILIIAMRIKKEGVSIERKTKEKKGEVKIKDISKEDMKREKKKQKKEKGKTEASEELIFSVPKWESDDEEGD